MPPRRHLGVVDDYGNKSHAFSATSVALSQSAGPRRLAAAPASIGVRDEFLLGIFPPGHGGKDTHRPRRKCRCRNKPSLIESMKPT
jgi:hypothetical protein